MKRPIFLLLTGLLMSSLAEAQADLLLYFEHKAGQNKLLLGKGVYATPQGETFTVRLLQYYVSQVQLVRSDGSVFALPADSSYFLIKAHEPARQVIKVPAVRAGEYTGIKFTLGVDSLRNTMPLSRRKGCLDIGGEANGMYWSWNAGYIFLKLEGDSPQAPLDRVSGGHPFTYHIGQFGGMKIPTVNNLREVTLPLSTPIRFTDGRSERKLVVRVDVLQFFAGQHPISIARNPTVMMQPVASQIADNCMRMFSLAPVLTSTR